MKTLLSLKVLVLSSLFFYSSTASQACSCTGEDYFCHEITDTTDGAFNPDHYILAVKLRDTLHGMFVRVLDNYIKDVNQDELLVWGDPGVLCRVYTLRFDSGDTIVLGLNQIVSNPEHPDESIGDYVLHACGITYLEVNNNQVEGKITENTTSMALPDFKTYMTNQDYTSQCLIASSPQAPDQTPRVYPNPASQTVAIHSDDKNIQQFTLFDASGKKHTVPYTRAADRIDLNLSLLPSGLYFLTAMIKNQSYQYRLMKL